MHRLTVEQWGIIITALVILNCAVFLVQAFAIVDDRLSLPEPEPSKKF